jgi:hypothetical protein
MKNDEKMVNLLLFCHLLRVSPIFIIFSKTDKKKLTMAVSGMSRGFQNTPIFEN